MHPLDRKKYRILNLSNGDKIIGEIVNKSGSSISIYRPYALKVLTMMDTIDDEPESVIRQEMLILKNWLDMSKTDKAEIELNHVLSVTEPTDKVCDFYDAEKAKDDNPEMMRDILKKLEEENYKTEEEDDTQIAGNQYFRNIIDDIILNKFELDESDELDEADELDELENNNIKESSSNKSSKEDDTDLEMYGW